jgi:hypothetical protein
VRHLQGEWAIRPLTCVPSVEASWRQQAGRSGRHRNGDHLMSIRRILVATVTLLSSLAIAGITTSAVAVASPQAHAITVRATHAPQNRAIRPDFRRA